jgi:hypothetical protein
MMTHKYGKTYQFALTDYPELAKLVRAAFPAYRKRFAYITPFSGRLMMNSYWNGGSRDVFVAVRTDGTVLSLPTVGHPYYGVASKGVQNVSDEWVSVDRAGNVTLKRIPDDTVVIKGGTFMGNPATATLHVPPVYQKYFPTTSME